MALSILRQVVGNPARFDLELGSNRLWEFRIGDEQRTRRFGIPMLLGVRFSSELERARFPGVSPRITFEVPAAVRNTRGSFIQAVTYAGRDRRGPAYSEILPLHSSLANLPPISLSQQGTSMSAELPETEPAPYDVQPEMSEAMFLNVLTGFLPKLLPLAGNLFGGLFGGGKPAGKGGGGLNDLLAQLLKPDSLKQITDLVGKLSSGKSDVTTHPAEAPRHPDYATANALPAALLAALPALMPIIEKVLNPETLKTIMGNIGPQKTIAAVTESVEKIGKLGLDGQKQLMGHLEKLHPKLASEDAVFKMVENMALNKRYEPDFRLLDNAELRFPSFAPLMLFGRSRVMFHSASAIAVPLTYHGPAIENARLSLTIKDARTLEVKAARRWKISVLRPGELPATPTLDVKRLAGLSPGEEYLLSACLIWRDDKGQRVGVCRQTVFTWLGDYAVDGSEPTGELIALDDSTRFRGFWHKVFTAHLTDSVKRIEIHARYFFRLNPEGRRNGLMESIVRSRETGLKKRLVQLRSGNDVALDSLLRLREGLGEQGPVSEGMLQALRSSDFLASLDQSASWTATLRGRSGETRSLWVYPSVSMRRVRLHKVTGVDAMGQVIGLEPTELTLPIPALLHWTEDPSLPRADSTADRQSAALQPAKLKPRSASPMEASRRVA